MQTFILTTDSAHFPLKSLVEQAATGEIQICDASGNILAYLTSPAMREDRLYAEAESKFMAMRDVLLKRMQRRDWITTEELCRRVGMPYHGKCAEAE